MIKIIKLNIFLLLATNLAGCANYLYQLDESQWDKNLIVLNNQPLCIENKNKLHVFGENSDAVKVFNKLLKENYSNLSITEASVLWTLLQFKVRPDLVNPKSRLQIFHVKNGKPVYQDFTSNSEQGTSLFYGLEYFLKSSGSRMNLKKAAILLSEVQDIQIPIGNDFSEFIQKNKPSLKNNPDLYRNYFKAGLELRKGESLPQFSFSKIINEFYTKTSVEEYKINNLLFNERKKDKSFSCNFDLNLYRRGIYLISKEANPKSWTVGIANGKGEHIFMIAGNTITKVAPLNKTFFISPDFKRPATPKKFCFLKKDDSQISIVSTQGRDPAQHLFHILNYDILKSNSLEEVQSYLNFPRHLFLQNPNRLLYESEKGSKDQLEKFLKLDFPIYHKQNLGLVYGHALVKNKSSFILDHRGRGAWNCHLK